MKNTLNKILISTCNQLLAHNDEATCLQHLLLGTVKRKCMLDDETTSLQHLFLGPVKRKCMLDDGESTPSKRHSSNLLITHTSRAAPYKVNKNWRLA